jgi:2-haloalkanoic acid dehalogenase type II
MELDGVFLDLYGTLTSGDRQAVESTCLRIVQGTGVPLTAQELSLIWGERFLSALESCNGQVFLNLFQLEEKTLVETLANYDISVEPAPFVTMLKNYWQTAPLQPEVRQSLEAIRVPICIVSNADQDDAEICLARHGIEVAALITSEQVRSYKPHPEIFQAALARTGWRRDRVIHVGDSLHSDVGGATAAGLRSGWLNRAHRIHDIGTEQPDHEFEDLLAFAAWLERE